MICYKDTTFCCSDCTNTKCPRHYSEKVVEQAVKWWGDENAPIALTDFSKDCEDYKND